jgi:hypothetical protein
VQFEFLIFPVVVDRRIDCNSSQPGKDDWVLFQLAYRIKKLKKGILHDFLGQVLAFDIGPTNTHEESVVFFEKILLVHL